MLLEHMCPFFVVEDETMTDRSDCVLGVEFDLTLFFCSSLNIYTVV